MTNVTTIKEALSKPISYRSPPFVSLAQTMSPEEQYKYRMQRRKPRKKFFCIFEYVFCSFSFPGGSCRVLFLCVYCVHYVAAASLSSSSSSCVPR